MRAFSEANYSRHFLNVNFSHIIQNLVVICIAGKFFLDCLTVEDGTDLLSRNVGI